MSKKIKKMTKYKTGSYEPAINYKKKILDENNQTQPFDGDGDLTKKKKDVFQLFDLTYLLKFILPTNHNLISRYALCFIVYPKEIFIR
ncbi:MAG: hypothetical protein N3B18_03520 [Desulfobacterota bacterium]|nr:hypothetical protein [Thermodesulfobacteriota bacterium]